MPTPVVGPNEVTQAVPSPVATPSPETETAMLPKISDATDRSERSERSDRSERPSARDAAGAADETTVLPPVRDVREARDEHPADRVPRGIFRDEHAAERGNERTRELPQFSDPHAAPHAAEERRPRGGRPRPDWAEETPLDDLPTLADELLGDHEGDDEDPGTSGRGRRPRR